LDGSLPSLNMPLITLRVCPTFFFFSLTHSAHALNYAFFPFSWTCRTESWHSPPDDNASGLHICTRPLCQSYSSFSTKEIVVWGDLSFSLQCYLFLCKNKILPLPISNVFLPTTHSRVSARIPPISSRIAMFLYQVLSLGPLSR